MRLRPNQVKTTRAACKKIGTDYIRLVSGNPFHEIKSASPHRQRCGGIDVSLEYVRADHSDTPQLVSPQACVRIERVKPLLILPEVATARSMPVTTPTTRS